MESESPEPGSFHTSSDSLDASTKHDSESETIEAKPRPDLVAKYSLFNNTVHPKSDVVYHPCGADDISPSPVFPKSRVVYADIDENSMAAVRRAGLEGHTASALEFDPGDVDILIMLNPAISPDFPSSRVVEGGYALVNDYHGTATELRQNSKYDLTAIIRKNADQSLVFDTQQLDDYWKEIESDEEFRNAPFNWGAVNYEQAVSVVEAFTGRRENVLVEYKKIIEKAKADRKKAIEGELAEYRAHPITKADMAAFGDSEGEIDTSEEMTEEQYRELLGNPDEEDAFIVNHDGRPFVLEANLPKKKGTVDDIFVFKKKKQPETTTQDSQPIAA